MLEERRSGKGSPSAKQVAAAVEWLAESFPEVACSLGADASDFHDPAVFWAQASADVEACLAYQDRFASGMDDKIRAAHLIAFYSHQLSLATGAVYLVGGQVPEVTGLRFDSYRRTVRGRMVEACRFHFLVEASQVQGHAVQYFDDAFVAHLKPVIALLKRRCGLASRAQWRLAADGLAGAFLEIGRWRGDEARAIEEALAIVKRPGSPLFSRELHYETINVGRARGAQTLSRTYRMRCGCCLFYRSDGGSFCDSCVLLDPERRRERLRAHLRESANE